MNECLKPHAVLHSIFGIGLGMILAGMMPGLSGDNATFVGFALMLAGFVGDLALNKKASSKKSR